MSKKFGWMIVIAFSVSLHAYAVPPIAITKYQALQIGKKVWHNEGDGKVSQLTSWGRGEDFASMGIGHFIWYPAGRVHHYQDSFPQFIKYMEVRGYLVPRWLRGPSVPACPWATRQQFYAAQQSPRMRTLRQFLLATVPLQAEFIVHRLRHAWSMIIEDAAPEQRPLLKVEFYTLAETPRGLYALIDYEDFKGSGLGHFDHYHGQGWGLLQVLQTMPNAPLGLGDLHAFVWAAKQVLLQRVEDEPAGKNDERWLAGWDHRVQSYLR